MKFLNDRLGLLLAELINHVRGRPLCIMRRRHFRHELDDINRVVPDDQVLPVALEIAYHLAKGATLALGEAKRLILSGATESLESQMEKESRAVAAMAGKVDGREGVAAFIGKRIPKFTGQ